METKIGHQIQKLRKSKNMSQEKLAEKLGVSRHSISNWEREVSNPELKTMLEITKLFNVSLNQLIKTRRNSFSTRFKNIKINKLFKLIYD